jgi:methylenetetrahydrofolate reductase (NADPH)
MRIIDRFSKPGPVYSFEFFPPKSEAGLAKLFDTIEYLSDLSPDFVSVTYGAGGGTRDLTLTVAQHIKHQIGIEPVAHLTCVGHDRDAVEEIVQKLKDAEIENILGLRGDPPKDQPSFVAAENGFSHANELIAHISDRYQVCVGGACYPEGHLENPDRDADLRYAKLKVDSGASFLVTQLFFDNRFYFDFVARARAIGIGVPIIPGIMPVTNVAQLERFTTSIGASIPADLMKLLDRFRNDEQAVMATGIEWATKQCRELIAGGAPGIHFYTLNKSLATRVVYLNLKR